MSHKMPNSMDQSSFSKLIIFLREISYSDDQKILKGPLILDINK